MDEKKIVRPVTVRIEDFKRDLNNAVGSSELPAYLLEILIGQYLVGVSKVASEEYEEERRQWEETLVKDEAGENNG